MILRATISMLACSACAENGFRIPSKLERCQGGTHEGRSACGETMLRNLASLILALNPLVGFNPIRGTPSSASVRALYRFCSTTTALSMPCLISNKLRMALGAAGQGDSQLEEIRLYPQPLLVAEGRLPVSDLHTIAWFEYGNPAGKPVLVVHGGPGGGTAPIMARFFHPEAYRIILVDQRGCGKSTPLAELKENTIWDLIADFEKVREKLNIERWQLFGGSWGSTLSLAYAITHPQRVAELVLSGIFLGRQKELDFMLEGGGIPSFFPEAWEAFKAIIPEEERADGYVQAYGRRLRGEMGDEEQAAASSAWAIWEGSIASLRVPTRAEIVKKWNKPGFVLPLACIENHYFIGKDGVICFLPREGWLLEEENLAKIAHIPTAIVQGRYDMVCPAISACELHEHLPGSTLHMMTAGHDILDPGMIVKLIEVTDKFAGSAAPKTMGAISDLHNLLLTQRSVEEFRNSLPEQWEDALLRAVEIARLASKNTRIEPCRFHLLGQQAIRRLSNLNAKVVTASKGSEAGSNAWLQWLEIPGWLIVTCVQSRDSDKEAMDKINGIAVEEYAACCCAARNICLSLHADGIGTKWTTGNLNFDPRFHEAAGLPGNESVIGTIWFGDAALQPAPPSKRLAMEDILQRHC